MKTKLLIMLIIIVIPLTTASANDEAKEFCTAIQSNLADINKQLPVKLDIMTSMIGASALYMRDKCTITYSYLIDERKFLESTRQSIESDPVGRIFEPTRQDLIEFANTAEGRDSFKQAMLFNLPDDFLRLTRLPFVDVQLSYGFDDGNIRAIQFMIE